MPRLWTDTLEAHRREVVDAILDTTVALTARHGLRGVTMAQIAGETGIGRATLYKYFPDVESILMAWHERHVSGHLQHLARLRDAPGRAVERLGAVLEAFALIEHRHPSAELVALLHRGAHVVQAQQHLHELVGGLLAEGAAAGDVRGDVAPDELATYCLHALTAAGSLRSKAAVQRLVAVTLTGVSVSR